MSLTLFHHVCINNNFIICKNIKWIKLLNLFFFSKQEKKIAISFNWSVSQRKNRMLVLNRFPWKSK